MTFLPDQLTESIQQSLLSHGVHKARVTLELLDADTNDQREAAARAADAMGENKNDVEVIIRHCAAHEEIKGDADNNLVDTESNRTSRAFMYSSDAMGLNEDQPFTQSLEIKGSSPTFTSALPDMLEESSKGNLKVEQREVKTPTQLPKALDLPAQDENAGWEQPKGVVEEVLTQRGVASPEEEERNTGRLSFATSAGGSMTLESVSEMVNQGFLPENMLKALERDKAKKERIKVLNSFVGKSVLLDHKKEHDQQKPLRPSSSSVLIMEAAVRAQERQSSWTKSDESGARNGSGLAAGGWSTTENSNTLLANATQRGQGESNDGTKISSGQCTRCDSSNAAPIGLDQTEKISTTRNTGARSHAGIQVVRFTMPTEDHAKKAVLEQLQSSVSGKRYVSDKDKYQLMMDDQQQILKKNDASQAEYKQLLDKAIEYNRSIMY